MTRANFVPPRNRWKPTHQDVSSQIRTVALKMYEEKIEAMIDYVTRQQGRPPALPRLRTVVQTIS